MNGRRVRVGRPPGSTPNDSLRSRSQYLRPGPELARHRGITDVEHIIVKRDTTATKLVQTIIGRVRNRRSIWLLIFNAHGNAGYISVGRGIHAYNADQFAALAPYMTPGGRGVEIHSCLAASSVSHGERVAGAALGEEDGVGVDFLRALAYYLGAPVRGSFDYQIGQDERLFGLVRAGDTLGTLEGPWVTVQPNGAVSEHSPEY